MTDTIINSPVILRFVGVPHECNKCGLRMHWIRTYYPASEETTYTIPEPPFDPSKGTRTYRVPAKPERIEHRCSQCGYTVLSTTQDAP